MIRGWEDPQPKPSDHICRLTFSRLPYTRTSVGVISKVKMEILLNSAWALVVIAGLCLWLRFGERANRDRRAPFVALAMVFVILFPVISVSDDLWSIQNPAETDTYQRRDHLAACPHSVFPAIAALPGLAFDGVTGGFQPFSTLFWPPLLAVDSHIIDGIENRPPPAA